jgi:hypothetical protein
MVYVLLPLNELRQIQRRLILYGWCSVTLDPLCCLRHQPNHPVDHLILSPPETRGCKYLIQLHHMSQLYGTNQIRIEGYTVITDHIRLPLVLRIRHLQNALQHTCLGSCEESLATIPSSDLSEARHYSYF